MEKYTRLELFEKLAKGELKDGQKFKHVTGEIVVVEIGEFTSELVWEGSGNTLDLRYVDAEMDYFTPYEEKFTVELTQEQLNTIFLLANHTDDDDMRKFYRFNDYNTASTWDIYDIFEPLAKEKRQQ
jgi:hypothetical protein